ncbi:MAG: amylo-alpha-1,6-glucosidase [Thermomicrobiales bacterium]
MAATAEVLTPRMSISEPTSSIFERPHVAFGREICGDLEAGLRREWIVTNGIGGFASATLSGVLSRSYHGLLVAALEPPVERTVLVGGAVEWLTYDGKRFPLSTHEFGDGGFAPDGYRFLESFRLEGALPVWTFAIADALVERRLWMTYGANTTYVTYHLARGSRPLDLEVTPLVTYRGFHGLASGHDWSIGVAPEDRGAVIRAFDGAQQFAVRSDRADFRSDGGWWWDFRHRAESDRGLGDHGDLFAPGVFVARLEPGQTVALIYTTEEQPNLDAHASLAEAQKRQETLLVWAGAAEAAPVVQQLVLAADQFLVSRPLPDNPEGRSVIAGYHWFNDWGRDTMISLPGLTLSTGRDREAASILRTFAKFLADGLLPNNFPDHAGVIPGYNTADATLWYVLAIRAYLEATGDNQLVSDLLPVMQEVIERHCEGTRYGIGVDPTDGLLRAGEPGVQLTWMDAKVGDWVVTPRIGKPVEINALWYNVLRTVASFLHDSGQANAADRYDAMAYRTRNAFHTRFLRTDLDYLADVVDGPDGDDWSLRPNQIFALSLPYPLLDGEDARIALDAVGRSLLTSFGLRSLTTNDPAYRGTYGGNQVQRDGAYHQGPVWSWLLGAYAEACYRLDGDVAAALAIMRPIGDHLRDAGLGSVSEIFEGDPPHLPRGCVAQAWGVAEVLRVLRMLGA